MSVCVQGRQGIQSPFLDGSARQSWQRLAGHRLAEPIPENQKECLFQTLSAAECHAFKCGD